MALCPAGMLFANARMKATTRALESGQGVSIMNILSANPAKSGIRSVTLTSHTNARLPVVLLIAVMGIVLSACGSSSGRIVSADRGPSSTPEAASIGPEAGVSKTLTIPAGSIVRVRLLNSISSASASSGQGFDAELLAPIEVHQTLAFPRGARLRGRVVSAKPSGRLHDPGFLRLTLDSIQTLDGKWIPISTSSVSARGRNHKRRNLTLIGGGSGVGALIGGLAGGGKGAAIGAMSGAAAGTAGAYASGRKEAVLPAEAKLAFRTERDITIRR